MMPLFTKVLANEFVIDEKPVPTHLTREEDREDLTELVSKVMLDNDRLQDLNEELKKRSDQPAETEKFMRSILPTLDSFDWVLNVARSHAKSEEADNWLKSVESIYFRLLKMLENHANICTFLT